MRANLTQLLPEAVDAGRTVPCFNVFGIEEARAYIAAAESMRLPVILATNLEMVEHYGVESLAGMLGPLARDASVPVCVHLDHCYEEPIVYAAIDAGYDSVMFDGSQLPLAENIARTRAVVTRAQAAGVSVEGEIGSVPYSEGRDHIRAAITDVDEAAQFAVESGVAAVAVSVGNVHRLTSPSVSLSFERLAQLRGAIAQPLVIHGASGIPETELRQLATHGVGKLNIGTALRQRLARALRRELAADPALYDRLQLFGRVAPDLQAESSRWLRLLSQSIHDLGGIA